jgi:circadian clock protein KaiB
MPQKKSTGAMTMADKAEAWELRLYVAGQTAKAARTIENLKRICEEHMKFKYHIEVIDIRKNPQLGKDDQILAVPTLLRKLPVSDPESRTRSSRTLGIAMIEHKRVSWTRQARSV